MSCSVPKKCNIVKIRCLHPREVIVFSFPRKSPIPKPGVSPRTPYPKQEKYLPPFPPPPTILDTNTTWKCPSGLSRRCRRIISIWEILTFLENPYVIRHMPENDFHFVSKWWWPGTSTVQIWATSTTAFPPANGGTYLDPKSHAREPTSLQSV